MIPQLLAASGNPEPLRSEAAWAHLCWVSPDPADSGTHGETVSGTGNECISESRAPVTPSAQSDHSNHAYISHATARSNSDQLHAGNLPDGIDVPTGGDSGLAV